MYYRENFYRTASTASVVFPMSQSVTPAKQRRAPASKCVRPRTRAPLSNETNARRGSPGITSLMQLEKERTAASRARDAAEREAKRQRSLALDEKLSEERRHAYDTRAHSSEWRGFNDYEVQLLRAEHAQAQAALEERLCMQEAELDALRVR